MSRRPRRRPTVIDLRGDHPIAELLDTLADTLAPASSHPEARKLVDESRALARLMREGDLFAAAEAEREAEAARVEVERQTSVKATLTSEQHARIAARIAARREKGGL